MPMKSEGMTMRTRRVQTLLFYTFVGVVLAAYLFPFYWMVLSSLKTQVQNTSFPPIFLFMPTFENYRTVLIENPFALFLWNSLIVALGSSGVPLCQYE